MAPNNHKLPQQLCSGMWSTYFCRSPTSNHGLENSGLWTPNLALEIPGIRLWVKNQTTTPDRNVSVLKDYLREKSKF